MSEEKPSALKAASSAAKRAKAAKLENQQPDQAQTEPVNLCAKVPKHYRQYWAGQAKLNGTTMTKVIIDALTEEFGLPPD